MHIKGNVFYNFFSIFTNMYKGIEQFATITPPFFVTFALFVQQGIQSLFHSCPKSFFGCCPWWQN